MTTVTKKPPVAVVLSLFFSGIFLSVESVRLMLNCRWKTEEAGFFIALCAVEITAGFIFVSANKRKMMDFLYLSGALLLTLHAGIINTTLDWVINFALAGSVIALLVRNKKVNSYLLFAAAFVSGLIWSVALPGCVLLFSCIFALFLSGTLIASASGLRHIRWIFLPLLLIQFFLFPFGKSKEKILRDYRDIHDIAVSTLPASLLTENEEKNLSVLQVSREKRLAEAAPWKILPGIGSVTTCIPGTFPPIGTTLDSFEKPFDIVSVEVLPEWSENATQTMIEKLSKMVAPGHGIMLFPRSVLKFMPQNKNFITVPGSEERRLAAVEFSADDVTCEKLEKRLDKRLEYLNNKDFMTPGVFSALFNKNPEKVTFSFPKIIVKEHSLFFWITLGVVWLLFRITFSRKENLSSFLSEADNKCSATLIILTGFFIFSENRIYACFPEYFFLFCIVFALPFFGKKGKLEKVMLLASIILPWLFTDPEPGVFLQIIIFLTVLVSCMSSGMTTAKIMSETKSNRKRTIFASLTGIFLGGLLFHFFFIPGNPIPLLCISSILRTTNLLRE